MTNIPSRKTVLTALLRADFTTQWRNRKSFVLMLLIPVIILISWKPLIAKVGAPFALGTCITIGLTAVGLMGYSNSVARDRDKGVFQRLRVAPVPSWAIMASRLLVQMVLILAMTTLVFVAGYQFDKIVLPVGGYLLGYAAALAGGAVYLGLGQMIVGLIKNPESVHSTTRLVYFVFIMVGMFGSMGALGAQIGNIVQWSPYGAVKQLVAASFAPGSWNMAATQALLTTLGYSTLFTFLGVKWFQWK